MTAPMVWMPKGAYPCGSRSSVNDPTRWNDESNMSTTPWWKSAAYKDDPGGGRRGGESLEGGAAPGRVAPHDALHRPGGGHVGIPRGVLPALGGKENRGGAGGGPPGPHDARPAIEDDTRGRS